MMDFQILYRQGVLAIRDAGDIERGRELLLEALELNPEHDMAWLWLTRTVQDPREQLDYVLRALAINPANETAQKLKARLASLPAPDAGVNSGFSDATPQRYRTIDEPVSDDERSRIHQHMEQAAIHLEAGAVEDAIREWVAVLALRVDHETALRNAAGHLWRQNYRDDAVELVQRALDAGTRSPTIYLTAIDMADRQGRQHDADTLRKQVLALPALDDRVLLTIADGYRDRHQISDEIAFLNDALDAHPENQALLLRLGDRYREIDQRQQAMKCYEQTVRLGARTPEGKAADQRLSEFVPVLTDRERGSVLLALREAAGIALFFLVLGWQDAGVDLLALGPRRWFGVLVSAIGGYLVVTATSSPQQRRIAGWFGGVVPPSPPEHSTSPALLERSPTVSAPGRAHEAPTHLPRISGDMRAVLSVFGLALLAAAFYLVFYRAIDLLI